MASKNPGDIALRVRLLGGKAVVKDLGDTVKGVEKTGKTANKASNGFENFSNGMDRAVHKSHMWIESAKGFAASWLGIQGVLEAKDFLKDTVKEALANQAAMRSFSLALKNTTHATDKQVESSGKWVESMATGYGFMKTDLIRGYQQMAQATHSTTKAQLLLRLAMDASAQTGKPLTMVTMALLRAQNGNVAALGRLGIATKDAHGKTKSFHDLIVSMAKTFKGGAKAAAASFQGQLAKLHEKFKEIQIRIGSKLLPLLASLASWVTNKLMPAIEKATGQFQAYKGTLGTVHHALNGIIAITKAVYGWFAKHMGVTKALIKTIVGLYIAIRVVSKTMQAAKAVIAAYNFVTKFAALYSQAKTAASYEEAGATCAVTAATNEARVAQLALNAAWLTSPIGLVVIGITALVAVLVVAWMKSKTFRKVVTDAFHAVLNAGKSAWHWIKSAWGNIAKMFASAKKAIGNVAHGMFDGIKAAFKSVVNFLIDGWNNSYGRIINSVAKFASHIPGLGFLAKVNVHIPRLAEGGIVKARPGGMAAILGEGGRDEAVIPLPSGAAQNLARGAHLTSTKTITTNVLTRGGGAPIHAHVNVDGEALFDFILNRTQQAGAFA